MFHFKIINIYLIKYGCHKWDVFEKLKSDLMRWNFEALQLEEKISRLTQASECQIIFVAQNSCHVSNKEKKIVHIYKSLVSWNQSIFYILKQVYISGNDVQRLCMTTYFLKYFPSSVLHILLNFLLQKSDNNNSFCCISKS